MKKRVAAAVLGIMLSVSMGLEVPAAALDSGFESGFTSEQAADVQTEDGAEAVQPSEDTEAPADTAAAEEQQAQESQDKEEHTDSEKEYSNTLDDCKAKFIAAMDDDLNTADAIAAIFDIVYASNTALSNENKNAKAVVEKTLDLIHELGGVLGLFQKTQEKSIAAEVEELI